MRQNRDSEQVEPASPVSAAGRPQPEIQFRIVPAQPADLNRYVDMLESVADWLALRDIEQWPPGFFRRFTDYYAQSIDRQEIFLAWMREEIIGSLRLLPEDHIVWPDFDNDALYVYNLAVARAWSGLQLGRRLLTWAEERAAASGNTYLRLDCFAANTTLRQYYESAGFTGRGEVNAHYPIGTFHLQRYEKRVATSPPQNSH